MDRIARNINPFTDFGFKKLSGEPDDGNYLHRVVLVDLLSGKLFNNKLHFIYLEVPKFLKKQEDLESKFDKWMYVLKNLE